MKSHNRMNVLQRTFAVLGATGTAALMTLPAFAQALPTQGVVNNGDVNRNSGMMNNQAPTSDNCSAYVNGGMGGPVDSQSNTAPSSTDTARTGIPNSAGSNTTNSSMMGSSNQSMMGQSNNQSMMGSMSSNNSGMRPMMRQFDGNNPSAAIAYRNNGPAGTAGHEAKMNLDAFQMRQNSYPSAYNFNSSNQASAPMPVACAPR